MGWLSRLLGHFGHPSAATWHSSPRWILQETIGNSKNMPKRGSNEWYMLMMFTYVYYYVYPLFFRLLFDRFARHISQETVYETNRFVMKRPDSWENVVSMSPVDFFVLRWTHWKPSFLHHLQIVILLWEAWFVCLTSWNETVLHKFSHFSMKKTNKQLIQTRSSKSVFFCQENVLLLLDSHVQYAIWQAQKCLQGLPVSTAECRFIELITWVQRVVPTGEAAPAAAPAAPAGHCTELLPVFG